MEAKRESRSTSEVAIQGALLSISCLVTYSLITHLLAAAYSVSRDDDLLGGMWAMVATVFAYRYTEAESVHAALSRMVATSVSFGLCLGYLLLLPFNVWGMTALIGVGTIVITMMGRPDDAITVGITIAVVMIVAEISPHNAWRQPILRLVDTVVGVIVGVAAAWLITEGTHVLATDEQVRAYREAQNAARARSAPAMTLEAARQQFTVTMRERANAE